MSEEKTTVHAIHELLGQKKQAKAYLIVISAKTNAEVGKMVSLDRSQCVLGRSTDAEFQIDDDGISRRHAKIQLAEDNRYEVQDLGSTNGTFVNGKRVSTAMLQNGDKIQIGTHVVLKFSLQDEVEENYQRSIYESVTRDGLTQTFNKKYFLDTLNKEFAYCLRHRVPLSLIMFDVDHFKKINDTSGHQMGDFVLTQISKRVTTTIRTEDLLARYGGEEFTILMRESDQSQAFTCAERCRRAVSNTPYKQSGVEVRATISLGIATLLDTDMVESEELVAAADKCLYQAKKNGRDRTEAPEKPT